MDEKAASLPLYIAVPVEEEQPKKSKHLYYLCAGLILTGFGLALNLSTLSSCVKQYMNHQANPAPAVIEPRFETSFFTPRAGVTWNIQLQSPPAASSAANSPYTVWDVDLFDTPKSTISAIKAKNHNVICYFSGGSYENWRNDSSQFPAASLGNDMDGWPGEKWVDTRNSGLRDVMSARVTMAQSKGCDGIDVDNIDGYENDTGFNLTKADGVSFVRFIAEEAHNAGLAYGLKNGGAILNQVLNISQWVVNEQCVLYDECNLYEPFIKAGKPVFHIEYTEDKKANSSYIKQSCASDNQPGFSTLIKHMALNNWTTTCP
jgi:endo-alpha-1,4-polygalactosaminidase (GH114 family)